MRPIIIRWYLELAIEYIDNGEGCVAISIYYEYILYLNKFKTLYMHVLIITLRYQIINISSYSIDCAQYPGTLSFCNSSLIKILLDYVNLVRITVSHNTP